MDGNVLIFFFFFKLTSNSHYYRSCKAQIIESKSIHGLCHSRPYGTDILSTVSHYFLITSLVSNKTWKKDTYEHLGKSVFALKRMLRLMKNNETKRAPFLCHFEGAFLREKWEMCNSCCHQCKLALSHNNAQILYDVQCLISKQAFLKFFHFRKFWLLKFDQKWNMDPNCQDFRSSCQISIVDLGNCTSASQLL